MFSQICVPNYIAHALANEFLTLRERYTKSQYQHNNLRDKLTSVSKSGSKDPYSVINELLQTSNNISQVQVQALQLEKTALEQKIVTLETDKQQLTQRKADLELDLTTAAQDKQQILLELDEVKSRIQEVLDYLKTKTGVTKQKEEEYVDFLLQRETDLKDQLQTKDVEYASLKAAKETAEQQLADLQNEHSTLQNEKQGVDLKLSKILNTLSTYDIDTNVPVDKIEENIKNKLDLIGPQQARVVELEQKELELLAKKTILEANVSSLEEYKSKFESLSSQADSIKRQKEEAEEILAALTTNVKTVLSTLKLPYTSLDQNDFNKINVEANKQKLGLELATAEKKRYGASLNNILKQLETLGVIPKGGSVDDVRIQLNNLVETKKNLEKELGEVRQVAKQIRNRLNAIEELKQRNANASTQLGSTINIEGNNLKEDLQNIKNDIDFLLIQLSTNNDLAGKLRQILVLDEKYKLENIVQQIREDLVNCGNCQQQQEDLAQNIGIVAQLPMELQTIDAVNNDASQRLTSLTQEHDARVNELQTTLDKCNEEIQKSSEIYKKISKSVNEAFKVLSQVSQEGDPSQDQDPNQAQVKIIQTLEELKNNTEYVTRLKEEYDYAVQYAISQLKQRLGGNLICTEDGVNDMVNKFTVELAILMQNLDTVKSTIQSDQSFTPEAKTNLEQRITTISNLINTFTTTLTTTKTNWESDHQCVNIDAWKNEMTKITSQVSFVVTDVKGHITVFIKIKPISATTPGSITFPQAIVSEAKAEAEAEAGEPKALAVKCNNKDTKFNTFYSIFTPQRSNEDVFEGLKETFDLLKSGYRLILFGYGSTGSGKSTVLLGDSSNKKEDLRKGVLIRYLESISDQMEHISVDSIFEEGVETFVLAKSKEEGVHNLKGKVVVLYGQPPEIDSKFTVITNEVDKFQIKPKAQSLTPNNIQTALSDLMLAIEQHRLDYKRIKATSFNPKSSRSHLYLCFTITFKGIPTPSTLVVVDMAGSEKTTELFDKEKEEAAFHEKSIYTLLTITTGNNEFVNTIKEGVYINESLKHLVYHLKSKTQTDDSKRTEFPLAAVKNKNKNKKEDPGITFTNRLTMYEQNIDMFFVKPLTPEETRDKTGTFDKFKGRVPTRRIFKALENLGASKKTKYVMLCTIRQEPEFCANVIDTLDFAKVVQST
jgi:DNA repair exonuclease SbcCD ATPase subunit